MTWLTSEDLRDGIVYIYNWLSLRDKLMKWFSLFKDDAISAFICPTHPTNMKSMCVCNAKNSYLILFIPVREVTTKGLIEHEQCLRVPTQAVIKLQKLIVGSNRNITADNWFAPIEVLDDLLQRHLTYVGAIKIDEKRLIPPLFFQHHVSCHHCMGLGEKWQFLALLEKSTINYAITIDEVKLMLEMICDYSINKSGVELFIWCLLYLVQGDKLGDGPYPYFPLC